MSDFRAVEVPRETNVHRDGWGPIKQRTKVLSRTQCPSCFRKGTMEVTIRDYGEYSYCHSCGHRETFIYG